MRVEKDSLGEITLQNSQYYGIATYRAFHNFNISSEVVRKAIVYELVRVKKIAAKVNQELGYLKSDISNAIMGACDKIINGEYDDQFIVNKHQGGAGTSTNMNVNEVIANVALFSLGKPLGSYDIIHPINHVNLHQSTNDTYPTAVKIAAIKQIRILADTYASLQGEFQKKETKYGKVLKLGRTEMMDALPMLVGQMFGAFAETVSRDRWRIYKVEERLRSINIGGTAIGTGLHAPKKYTYMMTSYLQQETNIGLSRADNLIDNTQNLDAINEVSSLLKVAASTLQKISQDLRFLASGPRGGIAEITLPKRQAGSSIMPGKVNPVILEMTIQTTEKVIQNDHYITSLISKGNLELNAFYPAIAESLLESLELLTNTVTKFNTYCVQGIIVNDEQCNTNLKASHSLITPLISLIGYDKASEVVTQAENTNQTIEAVLIQEKLFTKEQLNEYLNPLNITKPGKLIGDE